jgi:predicted ATPase/signal transduction histidine kinase/tRNA A-37 threonylcarbamoyl transferase component Bud32
MMMIRLAGYRITGQIYAGIRTLVYRGIRAQDRYPVAIKILQNPFPKSRELIQFRNQYTITKNLDLPSIPTTLALETYQNSYALVMEDCGGMSLKERLDREGGFGANPQTLTLFLQIAIQLADTLAGLYRCQVIHKDIKPANILFHPETQQIKLIDFGISSLLPRETQAIQTVTALEGTLAYISPEQTGRMNRGVDYRSDFYSLGVTFYQLLTGQLPFVSNDPLELVHFQLAQPPVPVDRLKPEIPPAISQIVSKLMAKNAEDRYQNALGLKHDLEVCLTQLQQTGKIQSFTVGSRDLSDRLMIPERLYGREAEVSNLLDAFERVTSGGAEMMLVTGYSGIGKTAIVQEVHKPIVRQQGYFVKGKFEQFQRNIPFSAFTQVFRDLIGQLLAESDLQLQIWKTKILAAVGENGQVLVDVMPELAIVIGQQLPAPELSISASQQRFNLLIQRFVRVFTTVEHPLVIFLDDLQWADAASLNLLKLLMQDTGHLLILGAYRDNEVSPIHPLMLTVDEIQTMGSTVNTISIQPLKFTDLHQLVADTLNCDLPLAEPLAKLVHQKTQGNPFFANQFLKALYDNGQISFDPISLGWQCDLASVKAKALTDDVVEFMALQLQRLPQETQDVLKLAACIGAQFDLYTLAIVTERSLQDTATSLWQALQAGLVIPTTEVYKFFTQSEDISAISESANPVYRFLHDRVQQAAYSLIPDNEKSATHLTIGRSLQQTCTEVENDSKLFDIVGHLNQATELITHPSDRVSLAQLNLNAGKKARNSTAYTAATIYLQIGIELLSSDSWETQYQLTLDLHVAAAEAAYLAGNLEGMEQMAIVVLRSAQTILDKAKIYRIQVAALTANGKMLEAISVGIDALAQLGIELPATPDEAATGRALQALGIQLEGRQIEDLLDLPMMIDLQTQQTIQLLAYLAAPIFISMPGLMPIVSSIMVSLSLQFGNSPSSVLGYVNHGLVLTAFLGDVEMGYRFGNLALSLLDRVNSRELKGRILLVFGNWIQHRQETLSALIPRLKDGYRDCMETGDFLNAGYGISCYFDANLLSGVELYEWEAEIAPYTHELERLKQYSAQSYLEMKRQVAQNLMTSGSQLDCLSGDAYDETVMIPKHLQDRDLTALAYVYIYKLMLAYLFSNYTAAIANITQAEQYLMAVSGMMPIPVFHFYAALTHLALLPEQSAAARVETLDQVDLHQGTIEQWAQHAPMNYQHKWDLIEAEKQRVLGNKAEAIEYYDRAISGAKAHQFLHEESLANELAAKFYLAWGKETIAGAYMLEAYYGYTRWGAIAKTAHLTTLYPQLLAPILNRSGSAIPAQGNTDVTDSDTIGLDSTVYSNSEFLDLAAILKAAQTIAEEIELDRAIASLLNIVIANAGADKCVLLLQAETQLQIVARVELGQQPQLLTPIPLAASLDLAISTIDIVKHRWEPLILNDAIADPQFAGDPYFQQHQPKSVLCTPILHQGKLVGILYLENQLTTGAFTIDRLKVLQLLTAQAAISIENAKLYAALRASVELLEHRVIERTRDLHAAKEEAERANKAKTDFFNYMNHELRTPLNSILGMSAALQSQYCGTVNQQQLEHLKSIETGGTYLLSLINDLLDTAKIEAGMIELHCTPVDLGELCSSSLMFVQQQAFQKQLQIEVDIPPQLPKIVVDEKLMRQVSINLLTNAVKFTPAGGQIRLIVSQLESAIKGTSIVRMSVQDSGIGITAANLQKLFQPFTQIDSATNRTAQGTGLGLNLVKKIVELHGGKVTVTSQIGVGSCFTIDLPCSDLPFIFPLDREPTFDRLELAQRLAPSILFIDDNAANLESKSSYLRTKGYALITAKNGREAIDLLLGGCAVPNLILVDLLVDDFDNLTAIEQLRQIPQFVHLPIIAITALDLNDGTPMEQRERFLNAKIDRYLSKPIRHKILSQTIQSCLAGIGVK